MSSNRAAHFARNVQLGVYHQNIFRGEAKVHERIIIRDGKPVSSMATPSLTFSLGAALLKALAR